MFKGMCACVCVVEGWEGGRRGWGTHLLPVRKNWTCGILGCNTKLNTNMPCVCVVGDACGRIWLWRWYCKSRCAELLSIPATSTSIFVIYFLPQLIPWDARTLTRSRKSCPRLTWLELATWVWGAAQQMEIFYTGLSIYRRTSNKSNISHLWYQIAG